MDGQVFGGISQILIPWSYGSHIVILLICTESKVGGVSGRLSKCHHETPNCKSGLLFFNQWWFMLVTSFLSKCSQIFIFNSLKRKNTYWTPNGPCAFNNAFSNLLQNSAPVSLNFLDLLQLEESILFPCLRIRLMLACPRLQTALGAERGLHKVAVPEITRSGAAPRHQSNKGICCTRALLLSIIH